MQRARFEQASKVIGRVCSVCNKELGVLKCKGKTCPSCGYMVCKNCRCKVHRGQYKFLCSICDKERLVRYEELEFSHDYHV